LFTAYKKCSVRITDLPFDARRAAVAYISGMRDKVAFDERAFRARGFTASNP